VSGSDAGQCLVGLEEKRRKHKKGKKERKQPRNLGSCVMVGKNHRINRASSFTVGNSLHTFKNDEEEGGGVEENGRNLRKISAHNEGDCSGGKRGVTWTEGTEAN